MLRWGFGPLGLKPDELWDLSWPEFWAMYDGFELKRQLELDQTRMLASEIRNGSFHRGKKSVSPADILTLPLIDGKNKKKSKETPQEFIARIAKRTGKPLKLFKG